MANILYFASLREQLDCSNESLELVGIATLGELKRSLAERGGVWREAFTAQTALLSSVNQQMASDDTPISELDEIAFFPPVTGG
jgi:molybdopterin synthase sulfur carrier subunit